MSLAALLLAAAVSGIPAYPGARPVTLGGAIVQTTPDAPATVKARYAEVFRKAGWKASEDDAILNGDVPGAPPEHNAAVRQAGTLLSFERAGRTADILITPGTDARRKPVTILMIVPGTMPATPKGGTSGRSAR